MGFPFLTGFVTKSWVKTDLPYEAKIIYSTAALLTSTVYARLIFDRVSAFVRHSHFRAVFMLSRLGRNLIDWMSSPRCLILVASMVALIAFSSLRQISLLFTPFSRRLFHILGGVLFISVAGIQADEFVKPVTRTLDLVGAPFLVAALLLANLLYLKI